MNKRLIILFVFIFSFPVHGEEKSYEDAPLIIVGHVLDIGEGSKYIYQNVEVIKVIRNLENIELPKKIKTANYSWAEGMPTGKQRIYLDTYY